MLQILNELFSGIVYLSQKKVKRKPFTQFQRIPQHTNLHHRGLHSQHSIDYLIFSFSPPPFHRYLQLQNNREWHSGDSPCLERQFHKLIIGYLMTRVPFCTFSKRYMLASCVSYLYCPLFLSRFNQLYTVVYLAGKAFVIL